QGLCFVGDVSMHEFLSRFIELKRGTLLDERDAVIGEHDGAALYTVGQRHGFHLAPDAPEGPYYVMEIVASENIVRVSKQRTVTEHIKATLIDIHWIHETISEIEAVVRYHGKPARAHVDGKTVTFSVPVQLTPGQSIVFYNG